MKALLAPVVAVAAAAAPAPAQAADHSDCARPLERSYSKAWHKVARVHGKRAPGRNIRRDGVLFRKVVFDATCGEIRRSRGQLRKLLKSPPYSYSRPVPPPQPPAGVRTDSTESVGGSSNPMVNPSCESGGNPQVVSPSGQYWGWYQFDYQTWVAHGGDPGSYGNAPLYVQHQVAARVQYDAWPNC
jgi:Transglycosylase-like domain